MFSTGFLKDNQKDKDNIKSVLDKQLYKTEWASYLNEIYLNNHNLDYLEELKKLGKLSKFYKLDYQIYSPLFYIIEITFLKDNQEAINEMLKAVEELNKCN